MYRCENCSEDTVIETSENFTCLSCHRVTTDILWGPSVQTCRTDCSDPKVSQAELSAVTLTRRYLDLFQLGESLIHVILHEVNKIKHLVGVSFKLRYATALIACLRNENIYVEIAMVGNHFELKVKQLQKSIHIAYPRLPEISIKTFADHAKLEFDISHLEMNNILEAVETDTRLSSSIYILIKFASYLSVHLINIQKRKKSDVVRLVSASYKISIQTLLKHVKSITICT